MKKTYLFLAIFTLIAVFVNFYKLDQVPACINADEAAFGYNTFSILKTLKDEHGNFLPLRLLSFNDMKLPLYSYLSMPFVSIFGLNNFSVRLLNRIVGILLVPVMYFLVYELFKNRKIANIAAFLTAVSPWIFILSRHAHETVLSTFFIAVSIWMLLRYLRTNKSLDMILSLAAIFLSTFAYHAARLYLLYMVGIYVIIFLRKFVHDKKQTLKKAPLIVALLFVLITPFIVDMRYGANRVNSLFFTSNSGYQLTLDEHLREHPFRLLHNKGTQFIRETTLRYFQQISPEFFVINGDENPRFGMPWLGPITPVEFVFVSVGLFYLFKKKEKHMLLIVSLLIFGPLSNSLTWKVYSLTRIYPMIIPIIALVSYGIVQLYENMSQSPRGVRGGVFGIIIAAFLFFNINSQDLYFNHYFERSLNIRSWQCGYKELSDYVEETYNQTDNFYITERYGQPYIFLLYFMQYDPARYQHRATISKTPDEYGFKQVENFDKFYFQLPPGPEMPKNSTFIGFPDEFDGRIYDAKKLKKITIGREEIFWIYKD